MSRVLGQSDVELGFTVQFWISLSVPNTNSSSLCTIISDRTQSGSAITGSVYIGIDSANKIHAGIWTSTVVLLLLSLLLFCWEDSLSGL